MNIGVIGCGNVGFAFLIWLYKMGFSILGLDTNISVRNRIINEIGIYYCANSIEDLAICDCIFICVPTEPNADGSVDMSIYDSVIRAIKGVSAFEKDVSIIQRSTCPPGTADFYSGFLGSKFSYGVNPSFLRKSTMQYDTEHPERIAYAGDQAARKRLDIIYNEIPAHRFITNDFKSVELLKYVENSLDSLLISFWNEILSYAKEIHLSSTEFFRLIEHISDREKYCTVSRIPGMAFGLSCLPKDLMALIIEMRKTGIQANVLEGAWITNQKMKQIIGESTVPAQDLWRLNDGKFVLLENGKKQILSFFGMT